MTGSDPVKPPLSLPRPTVAFTLSPIGIVHLTPPRRGRAPKYFAPSRVAILECFQPYVPGLSGLYEGVELWVLTYQAPSGQMPTDAWQGRDGVPGVFATDTVQRPNPIEFLRARVVGIDLDKGLLQVQGLDAEEGEAILDIRVATSPHRRLSLPGLGKGLLHDI